MAVFGILQSGLQVSLKISETLQATLAEPFTRWFIYFALPINTNRYTPPGVIICLLQERQNRRFGKIGPTFCVPYANKEISLKKKYTTVSSGGNG